MAKKLLIWEILRKGNYPQGEITEDMLKELSQTFGKRGDIPIGVGHDKYFWDDSLPAEGYIRVKEEYGIDKKGTFTSKGVELFEPLKTMYEEGRYSKWSAVIGRSATYNKEKDKRDYSRWELFAVDLLGRTAPAIKNLKDLTGKKVEGLSEYNLQFSETENNIISHNGNDFEIMNFSGDFTTADNTNETEEFNMDLEKRFIELENQSKIEKAEFASTIQMLEEEKKRFEEERAAFTSKIEEIENSYKAGQIEVLEEATKTLPEEMKKKLFSAIESTAGKNISFKDGEKKSSVYSVFAECLKQVAFTNSSDITGNMDRSFSQESTDETKKQEAEAKATYSSSSSMASML